MTKTTTDNNDLNTDADTLPPIGGAPDLTEFEEELAQEQSAADQEQREQAAALDDIAGAVEAREQEARTARAVALKDIPGIVEGVKFTLDVPCIMLKVSRITQDEAEAVTVTGLNLAAQYFDPAAINPKRMALYTFLSVCGSIALARSKEY